VHGRYKVQKPITTARTVTLEPRGGLLQVQGAWQGLPPRKPSSCIPSLKDNTIGGNSVQSIYHHCWPNTLAISNDSEELFPSLRFLGRSSLPTRRAGAEAHGETKPTQGLGRSRGHAPCQEGSRSSSPYPCPDGGSTDTSSAGGRHQPLGRPRRLGRLRHLPDGDDAIPVHPLGPITRAECSED
jgi:hypothetical protein